MKRKLTTGLILICLALSGCNEDEINSLNNEISSLKTDIEKLNNEKVELQAKVDEAAPWFKMTDDEKAAEQQRVATEKANAEKAEADRVADEKAEAEKKAAAEKAEREKKAAAAKAEREEQEKIGYNTGITFEQLARTPDQYQGKKVKFTGKVIQVSEDSGTDALAILRMAINSDYNKVIFIKYRPSIVSSRILNGDVITIYGFSEGLYTYEAISRASVTVPLVIVDKIDM